MSNPYEPVRFHGRCAADGDVSAALICSTLGAGSRPEGPTPVQPALTALSWPGDPALHRPSSRRGAPRRSRGRHAWAGSYDHVVADLLNRWRAARVCAAPEFPTDSVIKMNKIDGYLF